VVGCGTFDTQLAETVFCALHLIATGAQPLTIAEA
jgi:hypothetical protein